VKLKDSTSEKLEIFIPELELDKFSLLISNIYVYIK